ncbi:MAG: hypothetical protein Q7S70_01795, partial [bacterium]|nr:hypothetical protein [bacterium]
TSILSAVFIPISLWVIKLVSRAKSEMNICRGSQIAGVFSMLLGGLSGIMNFYYLFFIMLGNYIGNLISSSGRSGMFSSSLKRHAEESAAVDTVLPPLATAFGSFLGGLIIPLIGYQPIFAIFGALLFGAGVLGKKFAKTKEIS